MKVLCNVARGWPIPVENEKPVLLLGEEADLDETPEVRDGLLKGHLILAEESTKEEGHTSEVTEE